MESCDSDSETKMEPLTVKMEPDNASGDDQRQVEMLNIEGSNTGESPSDDDDESAFTEESEISDSSQDQASLSKSDSESDYEIEKRRTRSSAHDLADDGFVNFLLCDWHDDFTFEFSAPFSSGTAGLHVHRDCYTPNNFFSEIFSEDLLQLIVDETNKYAGRSLQTPRKMKSKCLLEWENVTKNDFIGFLAICVHMVLVQKPELKDYWSTDPVLRSSFAPSIMCRDRFQQILSMLHFSDDSADSLLGREHDPLHRIRPVYSHLQHKFRDLYTPGETIGIHERISQWQGKSGLRVYVKKRPIKWGMKVYEFCESDSFYMYNFELFTNKCGISNHPCDGVQPQPKTTPLERLGQVKGFTHDGYAVLQLADEMPVIVTTTKMDHPDHKITVTTKCERERKPPGAQNYKIKMAPRAYPIEDLSLTCMPLSNTRLKWWKKIFFHLFSLSLVQASDLYNIHMKATNQPALSLMDFIVAVGTGLNVRFQRIKTPVAVSSACG